MTNKPSVAKEHASVHSISNNFRYAIFFIMIVKKDGCMKRNYTTKMVKALCNFPAQNEVNKCPYTQIHTSITSRACTRGENLEKKKIVVKEIIEKKSIKADMRS